MVELVANTPLDGVSPLTVGSVTQAEVELGTLTSVAPFAGQSAAVSKALQAAHGVSFPPANRISQSDNARVIWFGRETALLIGPSPDASLQNISATTDQSDAWASVTLSGADTEAVLARLVPLDLRLAHFPEGQAARSLLGHMNAMLARTGAEEFLILVFRSMAGTLLHDLKTAMENVASRR